MQKKTGDLRALADKNMDDNRKSRRAFENGELKRLADKNQAWADLMHKKNIDHIKKMEETRLHTMDVEDNI